MAPTLPPFNIHRKVFSDLHNVDDEVIDEVQDEFCNFIDLIQENPYSPYLLSRSQRYRSKYAAEFYSGFVIYWKLKEESPGKVTSIEILQVTRVVDLL
jgi:hypothetical protein